LNAIQIRRGTHDGEFHPVAPIDDIVDILLRLTDGYTMSQAAGFLDAAARPGRTSPPGSRR
jgi:hypothetical protein